MQLHCADNPCLLGATLSGLHLNLLKVEMLPIQYAQALKILPVQYADPLKRRSSHLPDMFIAFYLQILQDSTFPC